MPNGLRDVTEPDGPRRSSALFAVYDAVSDLAQGQNRVAHLFEH